ncbi:hypothetical protein OC195_14730 [Priestia flexa]|nr:hypothetical protein OC195_14730 [Priestia flexa]
MKKKQIWMLLVDMRKILSTAILGIVVIGGITLGALSTHTEAETESKLSKQQNSEEKVEAIVYLKKPAKLQNLAAPVFNTESKDIQEVIFSFEGKNHTFTSGYIYDSSQTIKENAETLKYQQLSIVNRNIKNVSSMIENEENEQKRSQQKRLLEDLQSRLTYLNNNEPAAYAVRVQNTKSEIENLEQSFNVKKVSKENKLKTIKELKEE